jgi:hypothetical protein
MRARGRELAGPVALIVNPSFWDLSLSSIVSCWRFS